jgi:hypothetical protein
LGGRSVEGENHLHKMKLSDYVRQNPKVYIAGDAGLFLVEVCGGRVWRYETEDAARADAADSCGPFCRSIPAHRILKLDPELVPSGRCSDIGYFEPEEEPLTSRGETFDALRKKAHSEWEEPHDYGRNKCT